MTFNQYLSKSLLFDFFLFFFSIITCSFLTIYIGILYKYSIYTSFHVSIIFRRCFKITGCKFNLLVCISTALLDNCTSYLFLAHKAHVKSPLYAEYTQYVRAGCTRVQSRFCEGLEVGTRRDAAQGMFRRVGRTHTGGGKTWWPTGCGIHQRRCSAYLLRSRLFYRFPCTRVPRNGKREKERRGTREWLSMRKTLH